ncbi:alpha/beta hydrolase [Desertibacillus haloalkaliphilus]|nr:alpha/beta hydrolase [Desertibacillus haloalkaliphilus]
MVKRSLLFVLIMIFITIFAVFVYIQQWASTDHGKLPAKTAVILHAINNQLVPLDPDILPDRLLTKRSKGQPTMVQEDQSISVSDGSQIPVRIYRPLGKEQVPIIMYYHGGAFMEGYGNIHTHHSITRALSRQTGCIVISVGYRVAPHYVFPTAIEDSYEALKWAHEHAGELGGDPSQMAVVGDSAGGNIATVVATMARDRNGPDLKAQALFYPLTTFKDIENESRQAFDSGYFLLSRSVMELARESYTPDKVMWLNPYTSPLEAEDLSNLPPALVITAEFDPLRDEGEAYAEKLSEAGVAVRASRYLGVMHAFISFHDIMQSGRAGLAETAGFLTDAFENGIDHEPLTIQVKQHPSGLNRVRDDTEAFLMGAYLLGKSGMNAFTGF